jgi:NAD(P) transhydrogenase subunit alpha
MSDAPAPSRDTKSNHDAEAKAAAGIKDTLESVIIALILASVNIFGGFLVTERMLAMYKKKG